MSFTLRGKTGQVNCPLLLPKCSSCSNPTHAVKQCSSPRGPQPQNPQSVMAFGCKAKEAENCPWGLKRVSQESRCLG